MGARVKTITVPVARGSLLLNILAVAAIVALEVRLYPAAASAVDRLLGGDGSPGSSIGYFRDLYVLPAGIVFTALAITSLAFAARRGQGVFYRVVIGSWLLNLIAIFISSLWYFQTIRAAGEYRG